METISLDQYMKVHHTNIFDVKSVSSLRLPFFNVDQSFSYGLRKVSELWLPLFNEVP